MLLSDERTILSRFKLLHSIFDVPNVTSFFFDMYGVLWNGSGLYEHVSDVLIRLREQGKKVYILSNQTVVRDVFIADRAGKGLVIGTHYDDVITSGEVCVQALKDGLIERISGKRDGRLYSVGLPNEALFASVENNLTHDINQADMIYIGSLPLESRHQLSDKLIAVLTEALTRKLPAICANPDVYVMNEIDKHFAQGVAARWYEEQGGKVIWFGKPYEEVYRYALAKTGADIRYSVMVGDMLSTDIYGANQVGMRSVLVTETGISGFDMQTQKMDVAALIQQTAQMENKKLLDFVPTYLMSRVASIG